MPRVALKALERSQQAWDRADLAENHGSLDADSKLKAVRAYFSGKIAAFVIVADNNSVNPRYTESTQNQLAGHLAKLFIETGIDMLSDGVHLSQLFWSTLPLSAAKEGFPAVPNIARILCEGLNTYSDDKCMIRSFIESLQALKIAENKANSKKVFLQASDIVRYFEIVSVPSNSVQNNDSSVSNDNEDSAIQADDIDQSNGATGQQGTTGHQGAPIQGVIVGTNIAQGQNFAIANMNLGTVNQEMEKVTDEFMGRMHALKKRRQQLLENGESLE